MKQCGECDIEHPVDRLLCDCGEVLEEGHYLRWIGITSAIALALTLGLTTIGWLHRFSIVEAFIMEAALLVVMYPSAKGAQWLRDRRRPAWAEMGSVFSNRWDRCLVIGVLLLIFIALMGPNILPSSSDLIASPYISLRRAWLSGVSLLWLVAIGLIIRDQGLSFFDLRIANTYAARGQR